MENKQLKYEIKLDKINQIEKTFNMEELISFQLDDIADAYLKTKVKLLNDRMLTIIDKLDSIDSKKSLHSFYRELEDLEEMIYLLEKKYSKTFKKALKYKHTTK